MPVLALRRIGEVIVADTYAESGRYLIRPLERSSSRVLVVEQTDSQSASRDSCFILVAHFELAVL